MKGFEFLVEKSLLQGLRRFGEDENGDDDGLVDCYNFAPDAVGLRVHEPLTYIHGYQAFLLKDSSTYLVTEAGLKIRL